MPNIVVPQLGESVVEARIARWLKKEGDRVQVGEPLVELETEKIDLEVSAEQAGVLASIKHPEGADVNVGEVLGTIDANAGTGAQAEQASPAADEKAGSDGKPSTGAGPAAEPRHADSPDARGGDEPRATPTARKMATELGVNIGTLQGTGAAGRVMKADVAGATAAAAPPASRGVMAAPAVPSAAPSPGAPSPAAAPATGARPAASGPASARGEQRVRMSKRRATIARRLVEAQRTAAMLTTFNEIDMTAVMGLRERRKDAFKKTYGVGLGIASFFVKASIAALRAFPAINAEIQGDEIVYKQYYDIGMAVGAEGGLVVPVLRDADRMSFAQIEGAIRDYAQRARDNALTLDDLAGGTFTITNGGVFGSLMSTPILNPPQVGILGLHKIQDRAVPVNGQVAIRPMMYVALSYDHRIVDGREAVQFLVKIKEYVEDPGQLLIEG